MKKLIPLLLVFLINNIDVFSQRMVGMVIDNPTIPRLVNPHLEYLHINSGKIKRISILLVTNYYRSDTITRNLSFFSNNLKINEKQFRRDVKLLDRNLMFDSNNRLLKIIKFYPEFDGRSSIDTYTYNYDQGVLSSIYLDSYDKRLNKKYMLNCDSLGNPIKLVIKNSRDQIIGIEEALYDYDHFNFSYIIKDGFSKEISNKKEMLITKRNKGSKLNEQGDVIFIPIELNLCRIYEYVYDSNGNWIERKEYESSNIDQSEKKLLYTYIRRIQYKN